MRPAARLLPALLLAGAAALAAEPDFWTADELRRIDEGLQVLNATRADLGFQKRPIDDPFRLPVVDRILDEPLAIGPVAEEWDSLARAGDLSRLLGHMARSLGMEEQSPPARAEPGPLGAEARVPEPARPLLRSLVAGILDARARVERCFAECGVAEPLLLRKALLSQVERPAAPPEAADLEDAAFREAVRRVDRVALGGTILLLEDVRRVVEALRAAPAEERTAFRGTFRERTAAGDILIAGAGDDFHEADDTVVLRIDLGGNDTYARGASADSTKGCPVSVVIDLAGDDRGFARNDLSFGGALGGVAIHWDCGGNDLYLGGHVSCGAAILGLGVLVEEGGDDLYRCRDFCEGAGAFGIGLLCDRGGNDLFHADLFGQGFASTWGCGMLVEGAGNDVYDAGGVHLHAPLWRDRFQSLSQGFSIGMRPDASGGVGVLVDVAGNDRYSADIYGQGASYWYSLGLLIDDEGHDTYALGQYGQGSGIHLSAGMLLDRKGQDCYYDANGVGIGGAHDYSVGFLVDREGDDYYAGGGGAQGGALTNSVALLLDGAGDDSYAATRDGTQGSATWARNTGGIGLLLDGAGADRYTETARNDSIWTRDAVGAGIDEPTPPDQPSANAMAAAITPEEALRKVEAEGRREGGEWDLDKLWTLVTQWEVGDNTVIMPIARERFFALGPPALDRALENLGTSNSLLTRAIELTLREFAKGDRPSVVGRLIEKTSDADRLVRKNGVAMLSALEAKEALPRLVEMLRTDAETTGAVLAALATLRTAPPEVAGLLKAPKEPVAVQAAVCLGAVGDEAAIAALVRALGPDFAFPVRLAAQERLSALGAAAVPALAEVARAPQAPLIQRRNALRALGATKEEGACAPLAEALADPDRWIRFSARGAAEDLTRALGAEKGAPLAEALARARAAETDPLARRYAPR